MRNQFKVSRKVVMQEANALVKGGAMSRSVAMKQGYKVAALKAIFAAGMVATISFVKANGELRTMRALPASTGEFLIKGNGTRSTPKANMLVCDMDLGGAFRSFVKARLVSVEC